VTPPTRTPWGGRRIAERYKRELGLAPVDRALGESWEVSVEPSFPSRLVRSDRPLADVIAEAPEPWLGPPVAARYGGQTPLLVKLLDSADNLSVQVHPADGDPALAADESGKPESWIVLDADPGAGIYLGFRDGVDRARVEACLADEGPLDELLNFVPVAPGDVFVLQAGTAHAIGKGVTLVEPQFVSPGRRGITYRFWDWNRRYDADGKLDPRGAPRALHVERSLDVTDWSGPRGEAFVETCRSIVRELDGGGLQRRRVVDWPWFVAERWSGSGSLDVARPGTMTALTCVGGSATVRAEDGEVELPCGQSCVVPAAAGAIRIEGRAVDLVACRSPVTA
ncbi:MAG: class I mannose-6-phosphate isomerase, partial [Deltaproteobacteria bacterium]|jgi:mannose-6-phosphate isomerase|nr:class I mannose-6-phosphate isomerase [Deltaproteobacteria bacterium]MBW2530624.1 class I mannose-6-phosphate isomerase [Deltaproteobacteria bacterium]